MVLLQVFATCTISCISILQQLNKKNSYVRDATDKTLSFCSYKKTQDTLSQAGQMTSAAFSTMGSAIRSRLGEMRWTSHFSTPFTPFSPIFQPPIFQTTRPSLHLFLWYFWNKLFSEMKCRTGVDFIHHDLICGLYDRWLEGRGWKEDFVKTF